MQNNVDNIAVGVVTSSNLKERYSACQQTWLKDFNNTFLFGGNGNDSSLINFIEAGEDYNSHFLKQQLGLKYMYEHNDSYDWYCMTSCDAILFKENTLSEIYKYDHNTDFLLAQPCGFWSDNPIREVSESESTFRAISGGGGFFISNSLMKKTYEKIDQFNLHWRSVSGSNYPYSDVAISYMLKKYFNIDYTFIPQLLSQSPKHYEGAIQGDINAQWYVDYPISLSECLKKPMSFHYIKPNEMQSVYEKYKNVL
jgi:hypothetical protein